MDTNETNANMTNETSAGVRNQSLAQLEIGIQAAILTLTVLGNLIGLAVIYCVTKGGPISRMNCFIVHLILTDLFVAFFNVLPQLIWDVTHRFHGGDFLCRSVKYCQVVGLYASSYVLIVTAIDRYVAMCYPMNSLKWTMKRVNGMVGVAWVLALMFSIPQLAIFSLKEIRPGTFDCWATFNPEWTLQAYVTWFTVAIYIIPVFVLIVLYSKICTAVCQDVRMVEQSSHLVLRRNISNARLSIESRGSRRPTTVNGTDMKLSRTKMKTIELTVTVILCYIICWAPFFISQMWAAWDANAPFQGPAMTIIMLLASVNSCVNPWIYIIHSGHLRKGLAYLRGDDGQQARCHHQSTLRYSCGSVLVSGREDGKTWECDSIHKHDGEYEELEMRFEVRN